jgi:hypothetical protein
MTRGRTVTGIFVAVVTAVTLLGCSRQSPVAPSANTSSNEPSAGLDTSAAATPLAQPAPGSLGLSFFINGPTGLQPVTSLTVLSDELILGAHVANSSGTAATGGSVTFQYCSFKGRPPNDITRADEAPSSACDSGAAVWKNLGTVRVNGSGDAFFDFGIVQIPRTVGFRFRYAGQGSGIANGVLQPPQDFTWLPAV